MRVELTFKNTPKERELFEFLKKNSEYIGKSGYIKQLLAKELEREKMKKNKSIK